jgi:ribosome biogenesis GTPase
MVHTGSVWRIEANRYEVRSAEGTFLCSLSGKIRQGRHRDVRPAAVGDRVEFEPGEGGAGRIERVLPRRTLLARADVHDPRRRQVLIANLDLAVVVQAAARPALDWREADRGLVMAAAGGLEALLCINKIDLAGPAGEGAGPRAAELDAGAARYRAFGCPVLLVSAADGRGVDDLRERLKGKSSALLGPSGVGKSSLLNALVPGLGLKMGPVSKSVGQGRHTTTWFERIPLPGGGDVADAPGVEVFDPWDVKRADLAACFPEFEGPAARCKFKDCRHLREPGCAVKAALGGAVSRERYDSYVAIGESLRA